MAQSGRFHLDQGSHRAAAWEHPVTLRLASHSDGVALERLAQRDCRPLPPGPHLVAERDGRIEAAISLASAEIVADPFRRTAEICELLRCHAGGARVRPERSRATPPAPRPELVTA
jgi:hypothetical protein